MLRALLILTVSFGVCAGAHAELQNVTVGGEVRVRGRFWRNVFAGPGPRDVRIPNFFLPGRPIGAPQGVLSRYCWDHHGNDLRFVEQRTRFYVGADFTDSVKALIELESFGLWGEDFRSNYITGVDLITATADDVEVLQAYAEAGGLLGQPIRLRTGRQTLKMGKGWLVNDTSPSTRGLAFDAVRLTYEAATFSADGWWAKLTDSMTREEDGDVDFYGLHATWKVLKPLALSTYWYWLRDARALNDTNLVWIVERLENAFGLDDYDATNLHTVGLRAQGQSGAWDYDLECAYQFGEADAYGALFRTPQYGDADAEFDNWGGDVEIGYSVDCVWRPRVFVGGAYLGGEDNRDLSFAEWLSPFDQPTASVSFNRLFSGYQYTALFDGNQEATNFNQLRVGVEVHPTEKLMAKFQVAHYRANESFAWPVGLRLGRYFVPAAPALSFWTRDSSRTFGTLTQILLQYDYSDALHFRVIWEHMFAGDGLEEGSFSDRHGTAFIGGTAKHDADYLCFDTGLKF